MQLADAHSRLSLQTCPFVFFTTHFEEKFSQYASGMHSVSVVHPVTHPPETQLRYGLHVRGGRGDPVARATHLPGWVEELHCMHGEAQAVSQHIPSTQKPESQSALLVPQVAPIGRTCRSSA